MRKSEPSERMGKGVSRRGDSLYKDLEENEKMVLLLGSQKFESSESGGNGKR